MIKGYVRDSISSDVGFIASTMREADVAEVLASSGNTPEEALSNGLSLRSSGGRCLTICLGNGYPVGMYGVVPSVHPEVGIVWMLASDHIQPLHRALLRESRQRIDELCQGYKLVFNFTDARNHTHHRWIKWSGFTIIKKHEAFGREQRPFLEFVRLVEKHDV